MTKPNQTKALLVWRLFYGEEIGLDHPVPSKNDPKWIHVLDKKPSDSSSGQTSRVWAMDSSGFIFKAFYHDDNRSSRINGWWPAQSFLDNHDFSEIEFWMPLTEHPHE